MDRDCSRPAVGGAAVAEGVDGGGGGGSGGGGRAGIGCAYSGRAGIGGHGESRDLHGQPASVQ